MSERDRVARMLADSFYGETVDDYRRMANAVLAYCAEREAAAVKAEREACAAIADNHAEDDDCEGGVTCWRRIAAAIRARKKENAT